MPSILARSYRDRPAAYRRRSSVLVAVLEGCRNRVQPPAPSGGQAGPNAGGVASRSWTHGRGRFIHRFLATHGPGVHHVTFKVPDLDAVCRRAERHGYGIVGRDESGASWKEAFFHPKQALGIVVKLAEAMASSGAPGDIRRVLPDAPPSVRILGLRCAPTPGSAPSRCGATFCRP